MKNINPIFLNKEIKNFVYDLISDYSYRKYTELSFSDKTQLSGLLMKASGDGECIVESSNYCDLMRNISSSLINDNAQSKQYIYNEIAETAVDYYDEIMSGIFAHVYSEMREEYEKWSDKIQKYGDPDDQYDSSRL